MSEQAGQQASNLANLANKAKMAKELAKKNLMPILGVLGLIALCVGVYFIMQSEKEKDPLKTNSLTERMLPGKSKSISVVPEHPDFQEPLYDYYIKAAYNCCAVDQFSNSVVNENALKNVIKSGVRFLDFEIYSVDGNKPVIGISTSDKFIYKQNTNKNYYLADALKYVSRNAFNGETIGCKNPRDPILIHLRIKSEHKELYNNVAKAITSNFDSHQRLGKEFSYASNGFNLGKIPLNTLCAGGKFPPNSKTAIPNRKAKVIVIVNIENMSKEYEMSNLKEITNMESGGKFVNLKESFHIKTDQNKTGLIEQNKHYMTVVVPDKIPKNGDFTSLECCVPGSQNPEFKSSFGVGCQIVCMCFQNSDVNLLNYNKYFDSKGTAFVLQPPKLRYEIVCKDKPKPQKKSNSFATREAPTAVPGVQIKL